MDSDERPLVERAKTSPEAFGVLYDRYVDEIYGFVCARLHNGTTAQDVTAEIFLSALRAMPRYQDQGRPFSCWLYRIATNAVASHYRRQQVLAEVSEQVPDPAESVESLVLRHLEMDRLWALIEQLPPQQQVAMRLRFQEDRSAREAGRIMQKSEAAVKLLIYRAVSRLRSELGVGPNGALAPSARAGI